MKTVIKTAALVALFILPYGNANAAAPVRVETTSWGVNTLLACQQAIGSSVASGKEQCEDHGMSMKSYTVESSIPLDWFHCTASVLVYCN